MDIGMVHGLPDQELIRAIQQPNGMIPQWLALTEITRRQNLRQGAPQQAPQGTVAQNVVSQALRASGISTINASGSNGAQRGILVSPQPQQAPSGFANGGIVRHYDGGGSVGSSDTTYGGMIPSLQPLDPSAYQVQYQAPAPTNLDQTAASVSKLYGNSPNFQETLQQIKQLQGQIKPWSGKDTARTMGLAMMASKSGNPAMSLGEAGLAAQNAKLQNTQANNLAQERLLGLTTNVQQDQQKHAEDVADAVRQYNESQNTLAANQARMQTEVGIHNTNEAEKIAQHNQQLQQQSAQAKQKFYEAVSGNPMMASAVLADAKKRGDTATASMAQDALGSWQDIANKENQMKLQQTQAVEKMRLAGEYGLAQFKSNLEHKNKMQELGLSANGSPSQTAQLIANGGMDPATSRALLRRLPGMYDQVLNIDPEFDEANLDKRYSTLREFTNTSSTKAGGQLIALNTMIHHADLFGTVADALQNGTFRPGNEAYNSVSKMFGKAAPTNAKLVAQFLANESAKVAHGGVPNETDVKGILDNMSSSGSPEQMRDAAGKLLQLAAGRMAPLDYRVKDAKLTKQVSVLDPSSREILARNGFDPETMKPVNGGGGSQKPIVQHSPSTGAYRYSIDGGKTWQSGKPQ